VGAWGAVDPNKPDAGAPKGAGAGVGPNPEGAAAEFDCAPNTGAPGAGIVGAEGAKPVNGADGFPNAVVPLGAGAKDGGAGALGPPKVGAVGPGVVPNAGAPLLNIGGGAAVAVVSVEG